MVLFNNIQDELILQINKSTKNIKIAVTWFTNHDLFEAIINKLKNPEYSVDLIVLNDRINNKKEGVDFQKLIDLNGKFYYSENDNMVHHKFCIIDDKIVITGSYNWTYYAENRNWENIVILENEKLVKGYLSEFDKIREHHKNVTNVSESKKIDDNINSSKYLQTDYTFQAKAEERKGNDIALAKIYTEILRLNNKNEGVQAARSAIINKINKQRFAVCPFEIGIQYKNGYSRAIPAFTPLPITVVKGGRTPIDNVTSLIVAIQKYDYVHRNILLFSLDNIKPSPKNTQKIEYTLTVDQNGFLTVKGKELNGYNRVKTMKVELKKWL